MNCLLSECDKIHALSLAKHDVVNAKKIVYHIFKLQISNILNYYLLE